MSRNALGRTLTPDWRLDNVFAAPEPGAAKKNKADVCGMTIVPEQALEAESSPWMTLDEAGKEFFELLGGDAPAAEAEWEESASLTNDEEDEITAWARQKARRFWLTAAALMLAVGTAALAFSMAPRAQVAPTVSEAMPVGEAATVAPVLPQRTVVSLPVERGDTFTGLMAEQGLDGLTLYRTALPLFDLTTIQPGQEIVLHQVAGEELPRQVRYGVDGRVLVIERVAWDWIAYWSTAAGE